MSSQRLLNRNFVLLWQGQLVSDVGSQAFFIAVMYWLMQATGSASTMGLLMMASTLPGVLLGPFAGTLADRHSRKAIIVLGDAVRGLAVLGVAALFFLRPADTMALTVALFAVSILYGIIGAVFHPAIGAAIPDLVPAEKITSANSLNQLSVQGSTLGGQAIGGILFTMLGAPLLLAADGISYLLSALSESFIHLPKRGSDLESTSGGPGSYWRDTREGFRFVWGWPGMRTFILTATAINFLFMPAFIMLPFYVADVLGRGAEWYGFLLAAISFGSVVGLVLTGALKLRGERRARLLTAVLLAVGGSVALLGVVRVPLLAAAVMFLIGILTAMINVFVVSLVQMATPADMRGRVIGLVMALAGAATPLGMVAGGIVGDATGKNVPAILVTCGILASLVVAIASTLRDFHRFLATELDRGDDDRPGTVATMGAAPE